MRVSYQQLRLFVTGVVSRQCQQGGRRLGEQLLTCSPRDVRKSISIQAIHCGGMAVAVTVMLDRAYHNSLFYTTVV